MQIETQTSDAPKIVSYCLTWIKTYGLTYFPPQPQTSTNPLTITHAFPHGNWVETSRKKLIKIKEFL